MALVGIAQPSAVKNGAWMTLAACLSMMLIAGTSYGFGAWSSILKSKDGYGLNQFDVELLALSSFCGNYLTLDTGLLVSKAGTIPAFALGCTYASLGYFGLWAGTELYPGKFPFVALAFFCCLYGHGCGSLDNAAMSELMTDFSEYKGYVVGCTKAYYGLATAVMVTIFKAAFPSSPTNFLLFLAIYALVAGMALTPVIWMTKGSVDNSQRTVKFKFRTLTMGILVFSMFFFIVQLQAEQMSQTGWRCILVVVLLGAGTPFLLSHGSLCQDQSRERNADTPNITAR